MVLHPGIGNLGED
jgi:hypothetical protein